MSQRILIVDDAPIIRLVLKDILIEHGYDVVDEGSNGNEGVEKFKSLKPDLVTMDITMPEKNGIDALKEILEYDSSAKVIVITAVEQKESLIQAIKAGALDYIIKPFETDRVISSILKIFSKKE